MANSKIYGFFGAPSCDMIIYLAGILNNLGKRVIIVDESETHKVMSCFIRNDEKTNFYQHKDIDYTSDNNLSINNIQGYDYIFLYKEAYSKDSFNCNEYFVITDYKIDNLKQANEIVNKLEGKVNFILRDYCNEKLNIQYVLKEFIHFEESLQSINVIELDYYDYSYRILMEHEAYQGFFHISRDLKKCLKEIISRMTNSSEKIISKAYHRAERGKSIGSSFLE